jgi:hypothetical protein
MKKLSNPTTSSTTSTPTINKPSDEIENNYDDDDDVNKNNNDRNETVETGNSPVEDNISQPKNETSNPPSEIILSSELNEQVHLHTVDVVMYHVVCHLVHILDGK